MEAEFRDIDDVVPEEPAQRLLEPPDSPLKTQIQDIFRVARDNKENQSRVQGKKSIFDSQANGARIPFDDNVASQAEELPARPVFREPRNLLPLNQQSTSPSKRPRESSDEDPSEDEGFEQDSRQPAAKRQRLQPAIQSSSHPEPSGPIYPSAAMMDTSHRPMLRRPAYSPVERSSPPALMVPQPSTPPPQARTSPITARRNPGQLRAPYTVPAALDGDDPPAPTHSDIHEMARQIAKGIRRSGPQRARKTWTPEEENCLVSLIETHGCSWTYLIDVDRQGDNVLSDRTDGDLKDKARNLKVTYLM